MAKPPTLQKLRATLTADIADDIAALLEYNWPAECEDYLDNPNTHHVFAKMVAIDNWICGTMHTPEEQAGVQEED